MSNSIAIRLAAILGLFGYMAEPASAQNPDLTTNPENTGRAATATRAAETDSDLREYQVAKSARISLAQAIATAESGGGREGGRAIDADFGKAGGGNPSHYAIKVVYPDGKLIEYDIDADSGKPYRAEDRPVERYFTRLKASDFRNSKTSLKDAIALAERMAKGGKAYEAEVGREGDAVEYKIKVALLDREQVIEIGADGTAKGP